MYDHIYNVCDEKTNYKKAYAGIRCQTVAVAVNLGKLTIFMVAMAFSIWPININSERAVSTTHYTDSNFYLKKRKKVAFTTKKHINMTLSMG